MGPWLSLNTPIATAMRGTRSPRALILGFGICRCTGGKGDLRLFRRPSLVDCRVSPDSRRRAPPWPGNGILAHSEAEVQVSIGVLPAWIVPASTLLLPL